MFGVAVVELVADHLIVGFGRWFLLICLVAVVWFGFLRVAGCYFVVVCNLDSALYVLGVLFCADFGWLTSLLLFVILACLKFVLLLLLRILLEYPLVCWFVLLCLLVVWF